MDPDVSLQHLARLSEKNTKDFIRAIQNDMIASPNIFEPPFGKKKSTYTDWFASGKPLKIIENIMRDSVLPYYANTHTHSTSTARYTSASVANSRKTISRCMNAQTTVGHPHEATVLFCGDGSTSAIAKIRNLFKLDDIGYWVRKASSEIGETKNNPSSSLPPSVSPHASVPYQTSYDHLPEQYRPVVFISIQEHHSNLLPWRESCAEVVVIGETGEHQIDLNQLEHLLHIYRERPLKIGSFSAGSNITGVLNDTVAIAEILHKYDAFAFFDYAGVGAYTTVDMNPRPSDKFVSMRDSKAYKDGVFLSPHKMIGGPGSTGILVARLEIFSWAERNSSSDKNEIVPSCPAGGTVDIVNSTKHKYSKSVIAREESGTPNILGTIRAGLVIRLQEIMDPKLILAKEYKLAAYIYQRLLKNECFKILGTPMLNRVAVFSTMITIPALSTPERPMQIHYSLLSTIMNDFFGIEMRGGCMCAGPYFSSLSKMSQEKEAEFWELLVGSDDKDNGGPRSKNMHQRDMASPAFRLGFVRFSFPYFAREKDVEFVLHSLEWVAKYGYLLIPLYKLDSESGMWSVRQAVRRAVCQDIGLHKLNSDSRSDYVSIASGCIQSLHRLFKHQTKITTMHQALREPFVIHENSNKFMSPPHVTVEPSESHPSSTVFSTVNQARKNLLEASLLSNPSTSSISTVQYNGTSMLQPDCDPKHQSSTELSSTSLPDQSHMTNVDPSHSLPSRPTSRHPSAASLLDQSNTYQSCDLPDDQCLQNTDIVVSSDISSSVYTVPQSSGVPTTEYLHNAPNIDTLSGRNSPSLLSVRRLRTELFSRRTPSFSSRFKDSADGAAAIASPPTSSAEGISPIIAAALKELSNDSLEMEMCEVENSALAAKMRWFAIPYDVAQVYTGHGKQGSYTQFLPKP
ncbi:hypothetical protein BGZ49_002535 [Haplosporangium sp. Z 27]|nr:hypothetical protein BGZ49_002535 [Haplosporangium sp. Z 27]